MAGPSVTTVKKLFALSGNQCAFPGCRKALVEGDVLIGEVCHIRGTRPESPRFDVNQTESERHGFANLILLCPNHHKVVDTDLNAYTVGKLRDMKYIHESRSAEPFVIGDRLAERIVFALAGAGVALGISEIAKGLGYIAGEVANVLGRQSKVDELGEILRYAPKGSFSCMSKIEELVPLLDAFSRVFMSAGWRQERWEGSWASIVSSNRDRMEDYQLAFGFLVKDRHQISTVQQAIREVFAKSGMVGQPHRNGFRIPGNFLMLVAVACR